MKIAILTLPLNSNYGGILQAYALQTVLRQMGNEVIVINRRKNYPSLFEFMYRLLSLVKCFFRIYLNKDDNYLMVNPCSDDYIVRKELCFDTSDIDLFISEYIFLSQKLRSSRVLKYFVRKERFDCYIVGSDQVWREEYSPCITDYFLGFLSANDKTRKVSYAASFGLEGSPISSENLNKCIVLSRKFDAISVRELSGVQLMQDIFGMHAQKVLDPTLLLSINQYYSLINKDDICNAGLVSYVLDISEEKREIVCQACELLHLNNTELLLYPYDSSGKRGKMVSISKWLASFANAKYVVTDSFHGCVFSIIFKKTFIAIANKERGIDRFYSLLNDFGLQDRLIFSLEEFYRKKEQLLIPIDYTSVDLKHKELKDTSLQYLQRSLANPFISL